MQMQAAAGVAGQGKPLVQHQCRKGRKRTKLRHSVSRGVLHARGKGVRRHMDRSVVGPVLHQHTNDTDHVRHRHRKIQVP